MFIIQADVHTLQSCLSINVFVVDQLTRDTETTTCTYIIAFTSSHDSRFWQLHVAKHQSRDCTCTSLYKTQLQLTASSSYSLAHRRSSIRHCQSTSSRPATEPCNARHQPCITIVALTSDPAHPSSDTQLHHSATSFSINCYHPDVYNEHYPRFFKAHATQSL